MPEVRDLGVVVPLPTAKSSVPRPLDEARRSPIDQIGRAASALIVRRIVQVGRSAGHPDAEV
ncbi:MAG TPA: hypothetical protein VFG35_12290 [Actinoplanes sp.]|nr:hypothetical protein [Actinoplanes sp.]